MNGVYMERKKNSKIKLSILCNKYKNDGLKNAVFF